MCIWGRCIGTLCTICSFFSCKSKSSLKKQSLFINFKIVGSLRVYKCDVSRGYVKKSVRTEDQIYSAAVCR